MKISRRWAMPNRDTFTIKPIAELLDRWIKATDVVIDPFAKNAKRGTWTNDLNLNTTAQYHMHAEEFCKMLADKGVIADVVPFDPPYSPRQAKECYEGIGQHDKPIILWNREETIAALRTAGHVPLHEQQVRLALADLIENAHPVLGWANIQELVIAVKAKEHGVEVRTI